jgi:hypothetical protein
MELVWKAISTFLECLHYIIHITDMILPYSTSKFNDFLAGVFVLLFQISGCA